MFSILSKPDTHQKLQILSEDAQYDLACACSSSKEEHRKRTADGKWIYPVTLPNGGNTRLFKTLISNVCNNDCRYCPLRECQDIRRCSLTPEQTADVFLDYLYQKKVFGLFLTSGLIGTADKTMQRLTDTAEILRKKHQFKGFIHLKVIPGSSPAAIEKAVSLASTVSLNIETPGQKHLKQLSDKKDYIKDIIEPIKLISRLTQKGAKYQRVKQTTQFVVGASDETDSDIVKYMFGLYKRLNLQRVYFSAYQKGLGDSKLPAEKTVTNAHDTLTREHRLYQVDFLLRKYRFNEKDITFDKTGNLSLDKDPKQLWADRHPEFFPVNINRASRFELLKVPGLGPVTVNKIIKERKQTKIKRISDFAKPNKTLRKAAAYVKF